MTIPAVGRQRSHGARKRTRKGHALRNQLAEADNTSEHLRSAIIAEAVEL